MKGEEALHPGHRSIRLQDYDYSAPGSYFVTICAHEKRCIFGRISGPGVELNAPGRIVRECWIAIPLHFARVNVHAFVIMTNHMHGIIEIGCQAGAQHAAPLRDIRPAEGRQKLRPGALSAIVRSFKGAVTRKAREELGCKGEIWQRNYFERIVRDGQEFADASAYIVENPRKWEWDRENPEGAKF
jgi:REP-associated tyrosine transposase